MTKESFSVKTYVHTHNAMTPILTAILALPLVTTGLVTEKFDAGLDQNVAVGQGLNLWWVPF